MALQALQDVKFLCCPGYLLWLEELFIEQTQLNKHNGFVNRQDYFCHLPNLHFEQQMDIDLNQDQTSGKSNEHFRNFYGKNKHVCRKKIEEYANILTHGHLSDCLRSVLPSYGNIGKAFHIMDGMHNSEGQMVFLCLSPKEWSQKTSSQIYRPDGLPNQYWCFHK